MVELGTGRSKDDVREKALVESEDTEITLGTGKLLGIFFGVVFVCSIFFTLGYLLGHSTAAGVKTEIIGSTPAGGSTASKPSAGNKNQEAQSANVGPAPASAAVNNPPATAPAAVAASSPAPAADVKPSSGGGTFTVQVAAVSKKEDADNLVTALSKKQYPVFMATVPGDTLFHVQVGPFNDPKDAEVMRARLAGEGYDAIVKK